MGWWIALALWAGLIAWRVAVAGWVDGLIWLGAGLGILAFGLLTHGRRTVQDDVTLWRPIERARVRRNRRRAVELPAVGAPSSVCPAGARSRAPRLRRTVGSRRTRTTWAVFALTFGIGLFVYPFVVRNKLRRMAGGEDADRVWHEWHDASGDGTAPLGNDPDAWRAARGTRNPRGVAGRAGETPPPMASDSFDSIPSVADVATYRGVEAVRTATSDLVIEIPHGATRASHFDDLAAELVGPFPEDLRDFFFVNTDVGAPEVGAALAQRIVRREPRRTVLVIRCLVPRTFVDCNRVIDADAQPRASAAGEVTPGLAPYVSDTEDRRLLLGRYAAYRDLVTRAMDAVCGAGGQALMLHSYAPREVDVPVDDRIVERLRAAYAPDRVGTWPLRPEVDQIVRTPEGELLASQTLVDRVREAFVDAGLEVAEGRTYPLHPSTLAHVFARRHPGRTLCLELRRDLLVSDFTPFEEMPADPERVARVAETLARALGR